MATTTTTKAAATTTMTDDDNDWAGWPPPYPSTDISRLETEIVENIVNGYFPKPENRYNTCNFLGLIRPCLSLKHC